MSRVTLFALTLAVFVATLAVPSTGLFAQDVEREYCDDDLAENDCPGDDCRCVDDQLEVAFPLVGIIRTSVFRYREFDEGMLVEVEILLNSKSDIQAVSYGVRHDPNVLELIPESLNTDNTALDPDHPGAVINNGLNELQAVDGGFIHAVVLSLVDPNVVIPAGRHVVARATYRLLSDVGLEGTRIQIVDDLGQDGAPEPLDIVLSVDERSRQPRILKDGIVRRVDIPPEDCENGVDDDGDRLVDEDDPECQVCVCPPPVDVCRDFAYYFGSGSVDGTVDAVGAASFAISSRNARPLLGFQLGARRVQNNDTFTYQFSSELGTDEARLVELLMTDNAGASITPEAANQVQTSQVAILNISRGAATRDFEGGDFLSFDLDPGVGGPGFFLGYVSDLDDNTNQIPATGEGFGRNCPLNELLVVELDSTKGECPPFAYYFGREGTTDTVNASGSSTFSISSTNARDLLGFQLGIQTREHDGNIVYQFSGELGTDSDRLVELLMTDILGESITPATPNQLISDTAAVVAVTRGAATRGFSPGDFLSLDTEPGVGGPGFFVGYVSDLDGNDSTIPATQDGSCFLNELLVVQVERGDVDCRENGVYFGKAPLAGEVGVGENETGFAVSGRSADPLFGFQFGVSIRPDGDDFVYAFSNELGTDRRRLVEMLFTNDRGESIVPSAVNTLRAPTPTVINITRGSTLAPFEGGDFLAFDLDPGVGGPGFFVGYVSDLDGDEDKIPATTNPDVCELGEWLVVELDIEPEECVEADFAFFFGDRPTRETFVSDGSGISISCRNARPLFGFQFGVSATAVDGGTRYRFTDELGASNERLVEVLMTDNAGASIDPEELNEALGVAGAPTLSRGSALDPFSDGDFLVFDMRPGVGGSGFFVGYVSDLDSNENAIPATSSNDPCDAHQLLVIEEESLVQFQRGDADGNARHNVSDAVLILQWAVGMALAEPFDCPDAYDADDDGEIRMTDGIFLLMWKFQRGDALPDPFLACGVDTTPDDLDCSESSPSCP